MASRSAKGTYTMFANATLALIVEHADAKTAVLLVLEARRNYRQPELTYWDLGAMLNRPRRTLETALSALLEADLIVKTATGFASKLAEIPAPKTGQSFRQDSRQKAAKSHSENTVLHGKSQIPKEVEGSRRKLEGSSKPPLLPSEVSANPTEKPVPQAAAADARESVQLLKGMNLDGPDLHRLMLLVNRPDTLEAVTNVARAGPRLVSTVLRYHNRFKGDFATIVLDVAGDLQNHVPDGVLEAFEEALRRSDGRNPRAIVKRVLEDQKTPSQTVNSSSSQPSPRGAMSPAEIDAFYEAQARRNREQLDQMIAKSRAQAEAQLAKEAST
jgi:hypothetical protein